MKNAMSEIKRSDYGDNNPVISSIDSLSAPIGVPKAETFFLIIHDGVSFVKNAFPENPGLSLFISLAVARNISASEFQVLLNWSYSRLKNDEKGSFTILASIHGADLVLSTLLKVQTCLELWNTFFKSSKCQDLAVNYPEKVMQEFEEQVLQTTLKNAVDITLSKSPFLKSQLICLSNVKRDLVFNLTNNLFDNSIFPKADVQLNQTIADIIRCQADTSRNVA